MALTSLKTSSDRNIIQASLEEYAELSEKEDVLNSTYETMLDTVISEHPELQSARRHLEECQDRLANVKAALTEMVRSTKDTVKTGRAGAYYSNPVSVTYDLNVLERVQPGAGDIPNLVRRTVDVEVLEAALAAGHLTEEAVKEAKVETPRYKNGRVQVKVITRSEF